MSKFDNTEAASTAARSSETESSLVEQAKAFLALPDVRTSTDELSKRKFLEQKGLPSDVITSLLAERRDLPPIPPRSYPQLPPSRLPDLLYGVLKLHTWITGLSGAAALFYYIFLLPRISATLQARHALTLVQLPLLGKLIGSLKQVETEQHILDKAIEEDTGVLSQSFADLKPGEDGRPSVSYRHLVQSVIFSQQRGLTYREIISIVAEKFTGFVPQQGDWERSILRELDNTACFSRVETTPPREGEESEPVPTKVEPLYELASPVTSPGLDPLPDSLSKLHSTVAKRLTPTGTTLHDQTPQSLSSTAQRTLQALTDFTAYLSAQTYVLPPSSFMPYSTRGARSLGAAEDEVRKEIRSLKGLVLNRRTFASANSSASATLSQGSPAPRTDSQEIQLSSTS